jgi:hypothetical protein
MNKESVTPVVTNSRMAFMALPLQFLICDQVTVRGQQFVWDFGPMACVRLLAIFGSSNTSKVVEQRGMPAMFLACPRRPWP